MHQWSIGFMGWLVRSWFKTGDAWTGWPGNGGLWRITLSANTPVYMVESVGICELFMRRCLSCSSNTHVMHCKLLITHTVCYDSSMKHQILCNCMLLSLSRSCKAYNNFYWLNKWTGVYFNRKKNERSNDWSHNIQLHLEINFVGNWLILLDPITYCHFTCRYNPFITSFPALLWSEVLLR